MWQFSLFGIYLLSLVPLARADDPFPVDVTVDAAAEQGDLKPVWRFFGADEPNYATMPHGTEADCGVGRTATRRGLFSRAQPAHDRRWHACAQMGLHQCVHRRCSTAGPLTIGRSSMRIFDTYIDPWRAAVRGNRFHATGPVGASTGPTGITGVPAIGTRIFTRVGPTRRRITKSGEN